MNTEVSEVIGVDFGTSTSLIYHSGPGARMVPVPIGYAHSWMSSVVGSQGPQLLVGEDTELLAGIQVIRSIKSAIGAGSKTVAVNDGANDILLEVDDVIAALLKEIATRARD